MRRARFAKRGPLALAASAWGETFEAPSADAPALPGAPAVISICGPLTNADELFFDSYASIKARVADALEKSPAVVLKINSPGGEAVGSLETSRELRAMAATAGKRLVAFVDGTAASAAYALACACDEIVATPTAIVGSIGVIDALVDQTAADAAMGLKFAILASGAHKADGNPHAPIDDAAIAERQRHVDTLAGLFFALVEESRRIPAAKVDGFEARLFIGADAVSAGLADRVGTLESVINALATGEALRGNNGKDTTMTLEELMAAARKMAEEGTDEEKTAAKKMIAALEAKEGEEDPPKEEPKAEDDGGDAPPPKKDDEEEPKKPSAAASLPAARAQLESPVDNAAIDLAGTVVKLAAKVESLETREERARLLASRPDLMKQPKVKAWLEAAPMATVRAAVANIEKPAAPKPIAPAATVTPPATRGDGQGKPPPSAEASELDQRMGLAPKPAAIRRDGNRVVFGAMTAEEARNAQKGAAR